MIIENGKIQLLSKSVKGFDVNGYPVKSDEEWGNYIPCQFRANSYSNKGKNDNAGAFVVASFEILIDLPSSQFEYEQLRLCDKFGKMIGEYSIISATPLDVVSILKIMV